MYVCMYVCMYVMNVCNECMYACLYACMYVSLPEGFPVQESKGGEHNCNITMVYGMQQTLHNYV